MHNDLDSLLNNVFGSPKTRASAFGQAKTANDSILDASRKTSEKLAAELIRQTKAIRDMDEVKPQKSVDALCEETKHDVKKLHQQLENDGFAKATAQRSAFEENPRIFTAIETESGKSVFGQNEFLKRFVLSMKRPFATGYDEGRPAACVLVCGGRHTGRHTAVGCVLGLMQEKGLIPKQKASVVDLSLYPSPNEEKLFLQDVYMALEGKSPVIIFDELESCPAAFVDVLANLAETGEHHLSNRYTMQNGRLIDAGSALVTDAVSSLKANDKFLIFMTTQKKSKVVDKFGSAFLDAFTDVCETKPLDDEALRSIANAQCELLAALAKKRLGLSLACDESVAEQFSAAAEADSGAKKITEAKETMFDALSQWVLENDPDRGIEAALTAAPKWILTVNDTPVELDSYLPQSYRGALDEVKRELDSIVGLKEIKDYILSLEDNYKIQLRRRKEGMKTASVSMHMIFTGNPGTGKTTIARLVSRYLKAIGVLSGGQLIEVSRADLVGRYVGHTAPLTRSVIESALGGVLFIDEAYSLYRGEDDSFGLEAIDTLVKGIEDNRDNLVVILAGYSREMREFLTSNSGLKSRFPNIIEFPDYTGEELLEIAKINAAQRGYRFAEGVEEALLEFFVRTQAKNSRESGNGRLARNELEQAIVNQSRRLVAEPESPLSELRIGDFDLE